MGSSQNSDMTIALDMTITSKLKNEGLARELVNRIQNHRRIKDSRSLTESILF